ncbi:MAG TPA: four helix bundle protein [Chloroflexota bacterium]|nr:four helix bundle protein [Chloroflexota bacterium]
MADRPAAKQFEDLQIWRGAYDLALRVYAVTAAFPMHADEELGVQLRRAAAAIGAHIADGFARFSRQEYVRALHDARGALMQTRHFLHLAAGLAYLPPGEAEQLSAAISRLNTQLYRTVTVLHERAPLAAREAGHEPSALDN